MIPIVKLEQIIQLIQRVVLCCFKVFYGLLSTTNTEKIKRSRGKRDSNG